MKKALIALGVAVVALMALGGQATADDATMHNCPDEGQWAISVWTGEETDASEALGTCGNIEVAYALTPTGAWERYIAGVPEVNTLETIDQYQGVIALGGFEPAAEPEANVSLFGTLPEKCTINDLTMAIRSAGQGHSHARTGLHTTPLQIVDGIATRTWTQMAVANEVCLYCDGEFLQCADFPEASGDAHIYTVEVVVSGSEYEILPREHEYMYFDCGKRPDGTIFMCRGYAGSKIPRNPTCPNDAWKWSEERGQWCEGYPGAVWLAYECGPGQEPVPGETYCVR